jgi:electron transport complex protein RnfD
MSDMKQTAKPKLLQLSSSPHFTNSVNTTQLMCNVVLALIPAATFGVMQYGAPALFTIITSIISACLAEFLFRKITRQENHLKDLSAVVTGLLLALCLPPAMPIWITALGAVFSIVVVKELFGGLGANVFNPALGGRAFLLASFPAVLTKWHQGAGFGTPLTDAITTATPLLVLKRGIGGNGVGSTADLVNFLSRTEDSGSYGELLRTLFFGNYAGTIGESSAVLILAGALVLLVKKTIDFRAPLAFIVTAFVAAACFGMDPLVAILTGGLLFGAFFMATDYVSAPVTEYGKLIFGAGCGIITILIRKFGNYPEGVMYSILVMNAVTPFLNKIMHKKYGGLKKVRAKRKKSKNTLSLEALDAARAAELTKNNQNEGKK